MRQAYDYWQNQPDNYRDAAGDTSRRPGGHGAPRGATRSNSTGKGGHRVPPDRTNTGPRWRAGLGTAIHLPPLSSPRRDPPRMARPIPTQVARDRDIHASRGGHRTSATPERQKRALNVHRPPAYPQPCRESGGQRPVIHRAHPSQESPSLGVRLPMAVTPRPPRYSGGPGSGLGSRP